MKILIWVIVSLVVLGALSVGLALVAVKRAGANAAGGMAVRVEPATVGDLTETITAPGTIEAKTKVSISARVAARIIALPYQEGDTVTKGDPTAHPPIPPSVLVKLDATDLEAALKSSEAAYAAKQAQIHVAEANIESQKAQIESNKVQLEDAQRDLKRQTELLASKDVSQSIVDSAQAKVDQLKASLDSAEHGLEGADASLKISQADLIAADADISRAKDNLSYTMITSPIDGVVTRVNTEVGELVVMGTMNNAGTVIMEVADLSKMILKARVDESNIAQVKVGQKAVVRIPAYQDKEFNGEVSTVALADTVDTQAGGQRYFKAEILLDTKGQRIISGLNADVDIETATYHNVVMVPSQAVLGRPLDSLPAGIRNAPQVDSTKTTQTVVYRLINNKAVVTPVTVGASDVTRTVIKSGLKEGDPVITGPFKVLDTLANDQVMHSDGTAATQPSTQPTTRPTTQASTRPTTQASTRPATQPTTRPDEARADQISEPAGKISQTCCAFDCPGAQRARDPWARNSAQMGGGGSVRAAFANLRQLCKAARTEIPLGSMASMLPAATPMRHPPALSKVNIFACSDTCWCPTFPKIPQNSRSANCISIGPSARQALARPSLNGMGNSTPGSAA